MDPNQTKQNRAGKRPVRTPSERAVKKEAPRRAPSPEEKEAPLRRALSPEKKAERERRAREEARLREDAERRRLAARKARRALTLVSFVLAVVIVAAYWIFVAVSISTRKPAESGYPLLIYTDGSRKEDFALKSTDVVFHGTTYLPIETFQHYFPVTVYGTASTRSILMENGDEAKFYLGTDQAVVNGQNVSLSDISFLKEDQLYLPVDFFTDKMNCFRFTYSSADKSNVLTFDPTVEGKMVFQGQAATLPVDIATVPPEETPPPEASPAA